MENLIYTIAPTETPIVERFMSARIRFRPSMGGSMRKQRTRKAKPLKFTPSTRASLRTVYEWRVDPLPNFDNRTDSTPA